MLGLPPSHSLVLYLRITQPLAAVSVRDSQRVVEPVHRENAGEETPPRATKQRASVPASSHHRLHPEIRTCSRCETPPLLPRHSQLCASVRRRREPQSAAIRPDNQEGTPRIPQHRCLNLNPETQL
ncbi:hypothetical protein DPEC_G00021380 [Dallia pectoralis]|uniref:Uncharacterized protein n=1 Tax=Dallia pectoralis TaxID=75939 RepID=A0ACC2HHP2_DALPE|nr:hypothetical protein DPEC_G00021380 [Dallia pectoralis]